MRARRRLQDSWRRFPATTYPASLRVMYSTWHRAVHGANEELKDMYKRAEFESVLIFESTPVPPSPLAKLFFG